MVDIQKTDFVLKNNQVIYPPVTTDGLELYYDATGKKNTDVHKNKLIDMSGKARHGNLTGFSYNQSSGFTEKEGDAGLVFDQVDDTLTRPAITPALNPNSYSMQINNNIFSFDNGKTKVVIDGEVIELPENLVENGDFSQGITKWTPFNGVLTENSNVGYFEVTAPLASTRIQQALTIIVGNKYYISGEVKPKVSTDIALHIGGRPIYKPALANSWAAISGVATTLTADPFRFYVPSTNSVIGDIHEYRKVLAVDLTAHFGDGNEPTKEYMDALIERVGWYPSPKDYINRLTYKDNPFGDMEKSIDSADRDVVAGGNPIWTDKADENGIVHVGVEGKSVAGGSGVNLLNKGNIHLWKMASTTNNHTYTIKTTATDFISGIRIKSSVFEVGKRYTLSFKIKKISGSVKDIAGHSSGFISTIKNTLDGTSSTNPWSSNGVSYPDDLIPHEISTTIDFTGLSGDNDFYIQPNRASGYLTPYEIEIWDIQLQVGSDVMPYEPPAPSPDNPIDIVSLNDFDVVSSVGKENIILNSQGLTYSAKTGIAQKLDNYLGVSNVTKIINPTTGMNMHPPQTHSENTIIGDIYTLSVLFTYKGARGATPRLYMGPGSYMVAKGLIEENKFNRIYVTSPSSTTAMTRIHMHMDGFEEVYIADWKIEKGPTATPYSQARADILPDTYYPEVYKTNILLDEPLRSVGDVKDRLFRDVDGVWKVERKVGEIDLRTLNSWRLFQETGNSQGFTAYNSTNPILTTMQNFSFDKAPLNIRSTHFKILPSTSKDENYITANSLDINKWIWINLDKSLNPTQDLAGFNLWLSKTPVFLQYVKVPTIEILTQALQDKLNNIASYKDSNYIYTIAHEGLSPNLNATFKAKDWVKKEKTLHSLRIWSRALTNQELLHNYHLEKERFRLGEYPAAGTSNANLMLYNGGLERSALHFNYDLTI